MLKRFEIVQAPYRVTDFIAWQRDRSLNLHPHFQRRSVWKPGAKSYFIDTLVRGLPVPLIFIRERLEPDTQTTRREVVDGQQRLRTVFGFVDEKLIRTDEEFDPDRDRFTVSADHNEEIAGKSFRELDQRTKDQILGYRFSVQILPTEVEDRDVLQIFARLNATGSKLTRQELRNAAWHGTFKSLMYKLAYEQLERWTTWRVFSDDQISRMAEVELASDLVINMMQGLSAKTQGLLDRVYEKYNKKLPHGMEIARRFRTVMDLIRDLYGGSIAGGSFRREMHFFTLFVYLYDKAYGLGSPLSRRPARTVPQRLRAPLAVVDERFKDKDRLPANVLKAVSGAATDVDKRRTRLKFLASICDATASK